MDAQELRNLQEAYMEVVENQQLDEGMNMSDFKKNRKELTKKERRADDERRGFTSRTAKEAQQRRKGMTPTSRRVRHSQTTGVMSHHTRADITKNPNKLRKQKAMGEFGEQTDLYDIILSHLLDEGYAETPEAAEAIMVNMSEEWRDDIVEEFLDERNRGERGMSDREVTRRRNLGGNVRSKVSASSLGDHGPQSAIQKFHKTKANQRRAIHKSGRYTRGDTGESGGQGRYQANKDHSDGYPSITKRGQGPG